MLRLLSGALLTALLALPAQARTLSVPEKTPVLTATVPDGWKHDTSQYGQSATSSGDDVFFAIEFADPKSLDAMKKANLAWMKEAQIKVVEPIESEGTFNGLKATVYEYVTTDANGPTYLDLVMLPVKGGTAMLTLWGSTAERERHAKDVAAIMASVKPR